MKTFLRKYLESLESIPELLRQMFEAMGLLMVVFLFPVLYPCYQLYKKIKK